MLGPTSFKKAIEEAEKLSESLKLRSEACYVFHIFYIPCNQNGYDYTACLTRYEEVEVRKRLEEKERQEEKKRREEITEKGQDSTKSLATNKKDSKKVKKR